MKDSRLKSAEDLWLMDQEPAQRTRFLREFVPKDKVHRLDGIHYPISNAQAVEILLRCRSDNKYLKKIQGKTGSAPITRADDLMLFAPNGEYGALFFQKKLSVKYINLALIYQMTARSRRSYAKLSEKSGKKKKISEPSPQRNEKKENDIL